MIFPESQKHQHHSEECDERKGKHMRICTLARACTVSMETSRRAARPTLFCGPIEEDERRERKNERDAKYRVRTTETEIKQKNPERAATHHFGRNNAWNQAQVLLQTVSEHSSACVWLVSPIRTQSQMLPWHPTAETVGNTALHHSTNVYSIQETPSCVHWILITTIWLASTDVRPVFSSKAVSYIWLGCSYEVS